MISLFIDIGSTNIKYAIDNGEIMSIAFPMPTIDSNNCFEVQVDKIIDIVKQIVDSVDVDNVYISTQMHGYVLGDENGQAITNYISWRDKRFLNLGIDYPFEIDSKSGTSAKDNLPAFSIYAGFKLDNDLKNKAKNFYTLGGYVSYSLTGENLLHITDACPTGFYLVDGSKNDNLIKKDIFKNITFPKVTLNIEVVGEYKGKKIYVPIGDQQASVLGTQLEDDECLLNTGTATQLCCIENGFKCGDYESRPYFNNSTLCTITGLIGGANFSDKSEQDIYLDYKKAYSKLPKREKIVGVGGLAEYNNELFSKVCKRIASEYVLKKQSNAIQGLRILSQEIIK